MRRVGGHVSGEKRSRVWWAKKKRTDPSLFFLFRKRLFRPVKSVVSRSRGPEWDRGALAKGSTHVPAQREKDRQGDREMNAHPKDARPPQQTDDVSCRRAIPSLYSSAPLPLSSHHHSIMNQAAPAPGGGQAAERAGRRGSAAVVVPGTPPTPPRRPSAGAPRGTGAASR